MVFSSLVTSTNGSSTFTSITRHDYDWCRWGCFLVLCFKLDVDNSEKSTLEVVKCLVSDLKNEDACIKEVCKGDMPKVR